MPCHALSKRGVPLCKVPCQQHAVPCQRSAVLKLCLPGPAVPTGGLLQSVLARPSSTAEQTVLCPDRACRTHGPTVLPGRAGSRGSAHAFVRFTRFGQSGSSGSGGSYGSSGSRGSCALSGSVLQFRFEDAVRPVMVQAGLVRAVPVRFACSLIQQLQPKMHRNFLG